MTTRIRQATRNDIPDMAAIVVAWEKDMPWMPEGPTTDMIETAMDEVFDLRDIHVVSETPPETIVGYMSVDPNTDKNWRDLPDRDGAGSRQSADRSGQARAQVSLAANTSAEHPRTSIL